MISVGTCVKVMLKRRNMTQRDLLNKMKELKLAEDRTLVEPKISEALNTRMGYTWARRIEIALELPDYYLINMVGRPSEYEWSKIKEIKPHNKE